MGSGKKNKRGGAPKAKGRLQNALLKDQDAVARRAREKAVLAAKAEQQKNKEGGVDLARAKKQRKVQRQRERDIEAAKAKELEDAAALGLQDSESESEDEQPASKKQKKEDKTIPKPPVVKKRRGPVPYALGQRILLVGEGNFSFAHSLLIQSPPIVTPQLLIATAFDSQATAEEKYPDLMVHVKAIRDAGAKVIFGVDATNLHKNKELMEHKGLWDRVVFNFPHVGQGITDQDRNVRANQTLILNFFRSVGPLLRVGTSSATNPHLAKSKAAKKGKAPVKGKRSRADSDDDDEPAPADEEDVGSDDEELPVNLALVPPPPTTSGTVLITLRTVSPYSLWCLTHLGTRGSLLAPSILPRPLPKTAQPNYLVVRSFEFDPAEWEGYEHRRTVGFKEGVSSEKNDDLTLTARERGEKRREEKEAKERSEREERQGGELVRKGGKALMRTYEFELVPAKDEDDLYD
ncbi:hypothetical protein BCR35DRAFT_323727 [Leucosporidium creatinivorum]|uniref:25S rRNA (uridine-N(3))-methyltransferase BMT5-like domain-containing protein n=1 Tax=Leucosporidium creatinivorum TaxID=106004 RepID=A0A1Y2G0Y6_9BASI|nr:hypothetical protein BCR35DRAFT_323727 [Leucosporidium creatinivorum]